jgi:hypothetical protein
MKDESLLGLPEVVNLSIAENIAKLWGELE